MNTFSRFSVLSSEVDLDSAFKIKIPKAEKKKDPTNKSINGQKQKDVAAANRKAALLNAKQQTLIANKKKKNAEEAELQALAFGFGKSKSNKKNTTVQQPIPSKDQVDNQKNKSKGKKGKTDGHSNIPNGEIVPDDEWKKRDDEFVKKQNEKYLREAILQSKLEFEETSKTEKAVETLEKGKMTKGTKGKKRKEKPITISLDEFNSLQPKELASLRDPSLTQEKDPLSNSDHKFNEEKFFKDVEEATRRTLEKEHRQEQYKANANKVNQDIQIKKFISEIEKRDFEIQALRLEVESLRKQMHEVKNRNKKLCEVISCSEMRSKGELVVELEKVTRGREEFSEEVTLLNGQLEQERTKVSQLTNELKKMQGKKRNADSSSK